MRNRVQPFADWLKRVAKDKITVAPADINTEARSNLWSFGLSLAEAKRLTAQDVEDFILNVCDARADQLQQRSVTTGTMILYCWHDEQAGHLCFSMVSSCHGYLPFGAKLQAVKSLKVIGESWLSSPILEGIPIDEMERFERDDPGIEKIRDEEVLQNFIHKVWCTTL